VLFDGDEHAGRFAGVKTFVRHYPDIDGVMIGCPGNHGVVVGARGFHRAAITLHGMEVTQAAARQLAEGTSTTRASPCTRTA
jgi:acetylornithine deacetylase/succinyl-diaminopimelate desuccinylase-like protein